MVTSCTAKSESAESTTRVTVTVGFPKKERKGQKNGKTKRLWVQNSITSSRKCKPIEVNAQALLR